MRLLKTAVIAICGIFASVAIVCANAVPLKEHSAVNAYPMLSANGAEIGEFSPADIFKGKKSLLTLSLASDERRLVPLGMPFGIKLYTEGVIVVGFTDIQTENGDKNPCYEAGIRKGDVIISVDGEKVSSNENLAGLVELSNGKALNVAYKRNGALYNVDVYPVKQKDGIFKLGIWIRDSAAGVGTVSFVDPKTGSFGGLGHGICDVDTLKLMPLGKASVYKASVDSVIAGKKGSPGELCAHFSSNTPWGDIYINSSYGVYGKLNGDFSSYKSYPIASYDEIRSGPATVITSVSGSTPKEYSVFIEKISPNSNGEKNFLIRISDESLLEISNGIVQGMSGSPLIQNGKIIGAVTHVLVNDPHKGYGIFIENMLKVSKDSEKIAQSFN